MVVDGVVVLVAVVEDVAVEEYVWNGEVVDVVFTDAIAVRDGIGL